MLRKLPGVLVVGLRTSSEPILKELEKSGRYNFTFALDPAAAGYLPQKPKVVLLHLPADPLASQEALSRLKTLKEEAPVVVMSNAPDMRLYLGAMTLGAFDYFTSYTPVEEATRVLDRAISWRRAQAA